MFTQIVLFRKIGLSLIVSILITSCNSPNTEQTSKDPQTVSTETTATNDPVVKLQEEKNFCTRNNFSEDISITDLKFIDSNNVGDYLLKGRCKNRNTLVTVSVNQYKIEHNPKCSKGRWEVTLNLTEVVSKSQEDYISFTVSHNQETICEEVKVAFLGPKNYIPISSNKKFYNNSFYVMKYEGKADTSDSDAMAISEPKGSPTTRVSYQEALNLCTNNGSRYNLIRNSQWQNIALAIESLDENWSLDRATVSEGNALNCGVFRGSPKEASKNDRDDCANSSCEDGWDANRRTHLLPNGSIIWDMCGNAGEMMKDKYTKTKTFDGFIYKLSSTLKTTFGPKRTYRTSSSSSSSRRNNNWNLGYADINSGNDLIVRGLPSSNTGIFSVDITQDQSSRRNSSGYIGFRCVFIP